MSRRTRRSLLRAGVVAALSLSGCLSGSDGGGSPSPQSRATSGTGRSETPSPTPAETPTRTPTRTETPTRTRTPTETGTPTREGPFLDGTVRFLMAPTGPQDQMIGTYAPFEKRLGNHTGADVELRYARNYGEALRALKTGRADLAELGAFPAALGIYGGAATPSLQRHGYDSWTATSVLVTGADSDVEQPEDLEDGFVAFGGALSATGSLYPLAMLDRAGLSPPVAPGTPKGADYEASWSSSETAYYSAVDGSADAAGVPERIVSREGREGVRVLARESGIPRGPIAVSPRLTDTERETIRTAFLDGPDWLFYGADHEGGTRDDLWYTDVRPVDAATYQPVVGVVEELGYGVELFG